jgi:succinate dehydrogenase/fumarate reductase cytochrome b subunit
MPTATLRKVHSFSGLVLLGAYLLFHAYEQLAIRGGRDALIARLDRTTHPGLEIFCVLVPLSLHAALGLYLSREKDTLRYASPRFWSLQVMSGVLAGLFLLFHVATIWGTRIAQGRPAAAYGAMHAYVGTLPAAAVYLIGVTAVCVHFAQGLSAAILRVGQLRLSVRHTRIACAVVGVVLWGLFVDALMGYVTGAALL